MWSWLKKLWERLRGRGGPAAPVAPKRELLPIVPPADRPPMHLVVAPQNRPLCGASIRELWTIDPDAATCPECRREGEAAMLQWFATNR